MKRRRGVLTPLGLYLLTNRISSDEFAVQMANALKVDHFSARTVEKWRTVGGRTPSTKNMKVIKELTGITADQMMDAAA